MTTIDSPKILFVINPKSGSSTTNWALAIIDYFKPLNFVIELLVLSTTCSSQIIITKINSFFPQIVVAVGGDGTVKLVAECLLQTNILLGILPAGSANGLAKELGINNNLTQALDVIIKGYSKQIHATKINNHLCIHLSDIGLNAYAIKKFETQQRRGLWGYLIASLKALWQSKTMKVAMQINNKTIKLKAEIIVIANATKYGSGALINPIGKLDDTMFEVIVVKKISLAEIFKMTVTNAAYNPAKTQVFQTNTLSISSTKKVHFQVDGEYFGKVNKIDAILIPQALQVIIPS